jgi:recombinational DNA repair ATPase RecF
MFDCKQEYIRAFTARAEYLRSDHPSEAVLQAYDSLLNVLSNDVRFRAKTFIELSQVKND